MENIIHDDPKIYWLTAREAKRLRSEYCNSYKSAAAEAWKRWSMNKEELLSLKIKDLNRTLKLFNKVWKRLAELAALETDKSRIDFSLHIMEICETRIKKIEREINFNEHKDEILFKSDSFDIGYLKSIPIDWFVDITPAGFFKIRNEKTPSCKWYKDDNTWVDFGGDNQKHDVIDLVMILKDIDFREACKYLSNK